MFRVGTVGLTLIPSNIRHPGVKSRNCRSFFAVLTFRPGENLDAQSQRHAYPPTLPPSSPSTFLVSQRSFPKVTSSFDRQGPPPGAQEHVERKGQSPLKGENVRVGGGGGVGGAGVGGHGRVQQDYYTLSRAGITHLKDSSSDFTALDRWEREYALFHHMRRWIVSRRKKNSSSCWSTVPIPRCRERS